MLSQLSHLQIPQYLDYFHVDTPDNRAFYIVQQLAPGKPLTEWVQSGWRGTEVEIKDIARQLLEILQYLHRQSPPLIHRDLKPHNIIRSDDGRVFLVDFGAVQNVYHNTLLKGSTVAGTYGYMAPEQFLGAAVPGSDLYGLGATFLYLLTHRSPAELPQERLKLSFRSHVNISRHFVDWLEIMLEPDVIDRFPSVESALIVLKSENILWVKKNTKNRFSAKEITACIILLISIILGYQYRYALLKKAFIQPHGICTFYSKDSMNPNEYDDYINHGGNANDIVNVTWFDEDNDINTYYSLLQCAVAFDRIEIAELLFNRGADPNIYSQSSGRVRVTALHLATRKERYAKRKKSCEFSKLLLERGANPNLFDQNGNTPLHNLVGKEEDFLPEYSYSTNEIIEILDLFMKYRVNVSLANHDGDTALHIAAREKTIAVYDRMVAFGWNPEQINKKGESAKELLFSRW